MIKFFTVEYNEDNESFSGRFVVYNKHLGISAEGYDLKETIATFLEIFLGECKYYDSIHDTDLKKSSMKRKNRLTKDYSHAYRYLKRKE